MTWGRNGTLAGRTGGWNPEDRLSGHGGTWPLATLVYLEIFCRTPRDFTRHTVSRRSDVRTPRPWPELHDSPHTLDLFEVLPVAESWGNRGPCRARTERGQSPRLNPLWLKQGAVGGLLAEYPGLSRHAPLRPACSIPKQIASGGRPLFAL